MASWKREREQALTTRLQELEEEKIKKDREEEELNRLIQAQ